MVNHRRTSWKAAGIGLVLAGASLSADNWPQFRGPASQGTSLETGLPVKWSATENVRWKTALPGAGHSSPIVWGDRIFLTAFRSQTSWRDWLGPARGDLVVVCVDRRSGLVLWERGVQASAVVRVHPTNSPASPTPATDGKYVYVYFGSRGLTAFDFQGNRIWEISVGPFPNEWGSASSPVLYRNMVLLNCDTDADDFLLAVDKNNGKTIWKTSRNGATRSWPTPVIWTVGGEDQIVVSGSERVKGYSAQDGREIWSVDGLTLWVSPSPVVAHGLLIVASNGPGGNVIMAIRPGGRGNITATHVAWKNDRSAPYTSSPVVHGDYLYAVKNGGVMSCLNAKTGALVWQQRLPAGGDYYASLLAADGRIYALSEDGDATVLAATGKYAPLSANHLGERTMASIAVSGGEIFIRSDGNLFCITRQ